jgi:hypothetical protein
MDFTLIGLVCAMGATGFLSVIWTKATLPDVIIKLLASACTLIEIIGFLQYLNRYYPSVKLW